MTTKQVKALCVAFANHAIKPKDLTKPDKLTDSAINLMLKQLNTAPKRSAPDWTRARKFHELLTRLYPEDQVPAYDTAFNFQQPPIKNITTRIYDRLVQLDVDEAYAAQEATWLTEGNRYKTQTTESITERYRLYSIMLECEWEPADAWARAHE